MDIKTRDYVAAAKHGAKAHGIMLWEILPARWSLIVDFCLRIGYTTILLGTLGFFGLGLNPARTGVQPLTKGANCRCRTCPSTGDCIAQPCAWIKLAGRWFA